MSYVRPFVVIALSCACEPSRDPSRVYGDAARQCTQRYAPPVGSETVEIVLRANVETPDVDLEGMCIRLDDRAVLLADSTELGVGKSAERRIAVSPEGHMLRVLAVWQQGSYRYEVRASHSFDASHTTAVTVEAYEMARDVPMQNSLKMKWEENGKAVP